MSLPSRRSQDESRERSYAKTRGTHRDEQREKVGPTRLHRRPREGELQTVLEGVPERLARRIKES